jgi:hypothetical protein
VETAAVSEALELTEEELAAPCSVPNRPSGRPW